jgi:succinate dehydrogenase/fumarate reductase flavoprotein subunit
MEFV